MRGISLIEIVITASLILALSVGFTAAYVASEAGIETAGQRMRANLIAEEGLEAARNIRDVSFSNLVNGTYGISSSGTTWAFSGSSDVTDIFTRAVTISTIDAVTKQVVSTVTWPENGYRTGSVALTTYLTNTQLLSPQASRLTVNVTGAKMGNLFTQLQGITVQNTGSTNITISKITVAWTTSILQHINGVTINGTTAWSPASSIGTPTTPQSSGGALTLQPYVLTVAAGVVPTVFSFDGAMLLNVYTITFTMGDGSTKTVTTLQL